MGKGYFDGVEQVRDPQTYAVIGAAMEVHAELGCGFLEAVYQEAMEAELGMREVPFRSQVVLPVGYKGRVLKCSYKADLICFDEVIVEVKALGQLTGVERAQVLNYLRATGKRVALLINFDAESLQWERIVLTRARRSPST